MSASDRAVGAAERLHPLYLVTGLGSGLRQMIGGTAAIGYFAATGKTWLALMMLGATAAVTVVAVALHWRRFEYRVGANEIRIDSGIFSRTHRSIPIDRIQDVDITQGPVARLLGLARVRFETGGSAGNGEDDGSLAAIALSRAEALREMIRAHRAGAGDAALAETDTPPLFKMDLRRLLIAGLFNFSLAVIAALVGASQTLGDVAGFDIFTRRFWRTMLEAGTPLADLVIAHKIVAGLAGTVVLILVGLLTGIGRTLLRDYRFRLDRTATGLRRRRGLLTLTDATLPIRRVQAAVIASGPVRERFGWSRLALQSLARDEGGKGDYVVAPMAHDAEIGAILRELGWRLPDPDIPWKRLSPAYAWSFTLLASLLLIPVIVEVLLLPWLALAGLIAIAALVTTRWLAWRRFRYAVDGDRLIVRSGWWRRRTLLLPLARIQSIDVVETMISRRFGAAGVRIGVASGGGYAGHAIPSLPRPTAFALRERLLVGSA